MFEFELDALPIHKLRELEDYVEDCQKINEKKNKRKEADKKRREASKTKNLSNEPQISEVGLPTGVSASSSGIA